VREICVSRLGFTIVPYTPKYTFDHVHFFCSDLEASVKWFTEGMGAELVKRRTVKGAPAADLKIAGVPLLLREASA